MRNKEDGKQRNLNSRAVMYNHNGIINRNYMTETVKMMPEHEMLEGNVDKLLSMLVHLFIIQPYKSDQKDSKYLLPCLLPHKRCHESKKTNASVKIKSFQIVFPNNHMPPTFYHTLLGSLSHEWKLIKKSDDKPETYNLFACFRLDSETQQLDIYWKESRVYIDLKYYSTKRGFEDNKIFEILEIVKKRIVEMLHVYRHTNENYELKVQCPEHKNSFVSLAALKRDEEAMCYNDSSDHAVTYEKVFESKLPEKNSFLLKKPTDKHLGRLATYLVREGAINLAVRLGRPHCHLEADQAAQNTLDESSRRLYILYKWKCSNNSDKIGDLIELLTVTKDYGTDELLKLLEASPKRRDYAIAAEKIDCIPDNNIDIKIASKYIGARFPFLMLELGLCYKDVERACYENPKDMFQTVFCLLDRWRQMHPDNSTTRTLLDTANFVRIDTTEMQEEMETKL